MNFIVNILGFLFIIFSYFSLIAFWQRLAAKLGEIIGFSKFIYFIIEKISKNQL